ncbi:MAG: GNAT family N-acetyltransferase [Eubacteriales bacterium]|nr:GNAT family N-acetyltransferase [Eubacteriales bacterium]
MEDKFKIRKAVPGEGEKAAELIRRVREAMPEEEKLWLSIDALSEEAAALDAGELYGYFAEDEDGRAGGVFLADIPGLKEYNLGRHLDFSEDKLKLVAHMDTAAVLPECRGHRLQQRLMLAAEEELRQAGYKYLLCTVHPNNPYSHGNLEKMGYRAVWQGLKYGGKLRDIMRKDI